LPWEDHLFHPGLKHSVWTGPVSERGEDVVGAGGFSSSNYQFPDFFTESKTYLEALVRTHCDQHRLVYFFSKSILSIKLLLPPTSAVCGVAPEYTNLTLAAVPGTLFNKVVFASFGSPTGSCGSFSINPACNFQNSTAVVTKKCIGRKSCTILAMNYVFGKDPCRGTVKSLAVQLLSA